MLRSIDSLKDWSEDRIRRSFGGKAFGLYQASRLQLKIPQTWLIEDSLYEEFVGDCGTIPHSEFISKATQFIKKKIGKELDALSGDPFAVRSSSQFEDSSKHSFAGIFESKLDVPQEQLPEAIAEVWWSCHSERAQHYLFDARAPVRMAVLLQPMIRPKYAGIAFSRHPSPSTLMENHDIVIEFAPTSGEEIVQGHIIPMRLSGTTGDLSMQKGLPWLQNLLSTILDLKQFLHHEVDIEFVIDPNDHFWLVQQRPVSSLRTSNILDLNGYSCKYRRSLCALDVEMLIEGCSRFLPSYLELPMRLDPWLLMTTSTTGQQELWINDLLDRAATDHLVSTIRQNPDFLERARERYRAHFQNILDHNYAKYTDSPGSLYERFSAWCEFFAPLSAHYYAPMFLIQALHELLLHEMKTTDAKHAEQDLFKLGSEGISSLIDLLYEELRKLPENEPFSKLQKHLASLSERYGFLKCRVPHEKGYSAEELYDILKTLPPKQAHKTAPLQHKYFPNGSALFTHFKEWMRIRNQEMEYLMFAMQKSQPFFEQIAERLHSSPKELWNCSREIIASSLKTSANKLLSTPDLKRLTIVRTHGKTHVLSDVEVKAPTPSYDGLRGQTVYGQGQITGRVVIAFSPDEISGSLPFKDPHILVTGMTTPDFLPHLQGRFVALITDEGGILCHAAIVAREMALPCVVGTRFSTELLKTGDEITIDLSRGEIIRH